MFQIKKTAVNAAKGISIEIPSTNPAGSLHQVTIVPDVGATGSLKVRAVPLLVETAEDVLDSAGAAIVIALSAQKTVQFTIRAESIRLVPVPSTGTFTVALSSGTDFV